VAVLVRVRSVSLSSFTSLLPPTSLIYLIFNLLVYYLLFFVGVVVFLGVGCFCF